MIKQIRWLLVPLLLHIYVNYDLMFLQRFPCIEVVKNFSTWHFKASFYKHASNTTAESVSYCYNY